MFDGGNELRVRVKGQWTTYPLKYVQICLGDDSEPARGDTSYTTCKAFGPTPLFAASFFSPSGSIDGFRVSGNVGADGSGHFLANAGTEPLVYTNTSMPEPVYGYFKQIFGESTRRGGAEAATPDPSVNHLIIVKGAPTAVTDIGTTTDSDLHELLFPNGVHQFYYLMWGGSRGVQFTEAELRNILSTCVTSKWPPANMPYLYAFTDGYAGRSIRDGGNDMYDGGNYLNVRVNSQWHLRLPYTQDCDGLFPGTMDGVDKDDAVYSTCKLLGDTHSVDGGGERTAGTLFSAVIRSSSHKIDGFAISGNLGADGGGQQSYTTLDGRKGVIGYFKQVYGAQGDPSVNHLIIARSGVTNNSILGCDCSGCCDTPLDVRCVDRSWPANLPSLYGFSTGTLGTTIRDGGMDMYDYGNELRVRIDGKWSSPLRYTQMCDGSMSSSVRVGDAQYVTCKYRHWNMPGYGAVFVAVITSASSSVDGFIVNGNVGADGGGFQKANNGTYGTALRGAQGTSGYWKQIYAAGNDPSVNHLIFAQGEGAVDAKVRIGYTTDNDLHEVKFSQGVPTLYYVLWAGKNGYKYEEDAFQNVLDTLANACLPPSTYFPPDHSFGGGGSAFVTFVWVLVILTMLVMIGVAAFGCYKGWRYPKLTALVRRIPTPSMPGRSRTTPSSTFDPGLGPISSSTARGGGGPLAATDSATPYTPPPN